MDYNSYQMTFKEKTFYFVQGVFFIFVISYLFYRSLVLSCLLTPLAFFYLPLKTKELVKKRKREISRQFKEALYSLAASLSAGKSVESALKEVGRDLAVLYPDPDTPVIKEFAAISRKIEINETVEKALTDFAQRAHLEDISSFADVLVTGKRMGGNMVEIARNTSLMISDKLEIKEQIEVLLAQRKLEQRILNAMPLIIIFFLSWSMEDYMAPVFSTAAGRIVMTIALFLLGFAYWLSQKITDIEV